MLRSRQHKLWSRVTWLPWSSLGHHRHGHTGKLREQESTLSRLGRIVFSHGCPKSLNSDLRRELRKQLWDYGLLVLRGERVMTATEVEDFTRCVFGNGVMTVSRVRDPQTPEELFSPAVAIMGNPRGRNPLHVFDANARAGTHLWHVDKQQLPSDGVPSDSPYVAVLHMVQNAYAGHTTSFLDMHSAYMNLEPSRRSWWSSKSMWHLDPLGTGSNKEMCRRALLPLVRHHVFTGKPCLQLGPSMERSIMEGKEESQEAWLALLEEALAVGEVYEHVWEVGDILIWDNSQLMHRSNPYDKAEYVRTALRVGVTCEQE